jgi:hypothetical protein
VVLERREKKYRKFFYESVIGGNQVAELIADKKQLENID